jgi:integral membrane protein
MNQTTIGYFRLIAFIEGISYLILLFIAMPMKYMMGIPEAVKVIGMTHGILFILFMMLLMSATQKHNWDLKLNTKMVVASLIPFGTFFTDKELKELDAQNR